MTQALTWSQIHGLYSLRGGALALKLPPRYNGAPTQDFAACRLDAAGERRVAKLRWGLTPSWARDVRMGSKLINARAETVHEKPAFRAAFRTRRCVVPVNGWFEWQPGPAGKQPYFLTSADAAPLSLAGLWERWSRDGETIESFTIVTTAASPTLAGIHDRQPSIISPGQLGEWLDPASPATRLLEMVQERKDGPFECRAVSTRVNSTRNDTQDILAPTTVAGNGGAARPV